MTKIIPILLIGAMLGGCATRAEIRAAGMAEDEATCRQIGFADEALAQCRFTSMQAREDRRTRIKAAMMGSGDVFPLGSAFNPLTVHGVGQ